MATPATTKQVTPATIENVLVRGDLTGLTETQRVEYVGKLCHSLGVNPLTVPFEYLTLGGRLVLYAKRALTDQLRKIHGISLTVDKPIQVGDLLTVHVSAKDKTERVDEDFGVVAIGNAKGELAANLIMKAVTKGKRRVTLSICGLGFLDESEIPETAIPAGAGAGLAISKEQLDELIALADNAGANKKLFCEFLGARWGMDISSLAVIPAQNFDDAKAQLERKLIAKAEPDTSEDLGRPA